MSAKPFTPPAPSGKSARRTVPALGPALPSLRFPQGMTRARFMREYWQKKPLLMRAAWPGDALGLTPQALFDLAGRDDVEARLVERKGDAWTLQHGPFDALPLPAAATRRGKSWTVLVQGVNLHLDAADALLRQFSFISAARLDDLMVSYASDGGGVGPHFDSYDVFLLQTLGQRRWRISAGTPARLVDGVPLKILADFASEQEWLLEPGDMLYLPPQYAHEGTASGPCMTASIGFRAPALAELGSEFLHDCADHLDWPGRYSDPDRRPTRHPAQIDDHLVDALAGQLARLHWRRADMADFLARHLSEPKPQVFFDAPQRRLGLAAFKARAQRAGVRLHKKTTMLYTAATLSINGESCTGRSGPARTLLRRLADQRCLSAADCVALATDADLATLLHAWHDDGWLELQPANRARGPAA